MEWNFDKKFASLISQDVPRSPIRISYCDHEPSYSGLSPTADLPIPEDGFIATYCMNRKEAGN